MSVEQILMYLTPLIVWAVTELLRRLPITPENGLVIITVVVPLLSGLGAWLVTLVSPESEFWVQFAGGLGAIIISQVIIQFKKAFGSPGK